MILIHASILVSHYSFNGFVSLENFFGKKLHGSHIEGWDPIPMGFKTTIRMHASIFTSAITCEATCS